MGNTIKNMTNKQAITIANYCAILYKSKQINFGVARKLAQNAKIISAIYEQASEIKKVADDKKASEDELKLELLELENKLFEQVFEVINIEKVENVGFEEVEHSGKTYNVTDILLYLSDNEIIK